MARERMILVRLDDKEWDTLNRALEKLRRVLRDTTGWEDDHRLTTLFRTFAILHAEDFLREPPSPQY